MPNYKRLPIQVTPQFQSVIDEISDFIEERTNVGCRRPSLTEALYHAAVVFRDQIRVSENGTCKEPFKRKDIIDILK